MQPAAERRHKYTLTMEASLNKIAGANQGELYFSLSSTAGCLRTRPFLFVVHLHSPFVFLYLKDAKQD